LENDAGQSIFDHHEKADHIWQAFKERLGVLDFTSIQFNLDTLMQASVDLSSLVVPFTNQEIDAVIKGLPSDKAPGLMVLIQILSKNVGLLSARISTICVMISMM
jgi:hypothetical protein